MAKKLNISFRLRGNRALKSFVQGALVMPYFVVEGRGVRRPIASMPGVARLSVDLLVKEVGNARDLGVEAVLLFGVPATKDDMALGAYVDHGIVQQAVRAIKKNVKGILVITDVCLCEFMSHGHCGVVTQAPVGRKKVCLKDFIDLEMTRSLLAKTALSHARAGADMVAPSARMPGQVRAIRRALDKAGFKKTPIMSYSAKFASAFYGPFRNAADSAPQFGDRRSYQLDPANAGAALKAVADDMAQGADIVMVKPGMPYLDIIRQVSDRFPLPLAAYNVSGEYSMVKSAAAHGWIDQKEMVMEIYTGLKRAGASIVISYHACDLARWIKEL